jgi:hypothetical protein
MERLDCQRSKLTVIDMSGQEKYLSLWEHFFGDAQVGSGSIQRMGLIRGQAQWRARPAWVYQLLRCQSVQVLGQGPQAHTCRRPCCMYCMYMWSVVLRCAA